MMREGEQQLPSESAGKLRCPACGLLNEPDAASCARCGQRLRAREVSELEDPWGLEPRRAERDAGVPTGIGREAEGREEHADEPAAGPLGAPPEAAAESARQERMAETQEPAVAQQQPSEEGVRYSFAPATGRERAVVLPAGLGRRTAAFLLDLVLVMLLSGLLLVFTDSQWVVMEYQGHLLSGEQGLLNAASVPAHVATAWNYLSIAIFILVVGYFGIFSGYGGQTLGKAAMGIRLSRSDGREVGLWVGIFRALVLWLAIDLTFGFYLVFAAFMVMLDREGRSIHDLFFGTNVFLVQRAEH